MADTEKQITILDGTLPKTLYTKVEEGKLEDGTPYEKWQATAPRTLTTEIADSKGRNLDVRLDEMQTQLNGATTDISATIETAITKRAEDDIATKEELKYNNVELIKNGNFKLNTNGLSEYTAIGECANGWGFYSTGGGSVGVDTENGAVTITNTDNTKYTEISQTIGYLRAGEQYTLSLEVDGVRYSYRIVGGTYIGWTTAVFGNVAMYYVQNQEETSELLMLRVSDIVSATLREASLKPLPYVTEYTAPDTELEKVRCGVYGDDKFLSLTGGGTLTGDLLIDNGDGVSEGGEIHLKKPNNATLEGDIIIDANADRLRFFKWNERFHGAQLLFSECGSVDNNRLLHTGISRPVTVDASAPTDTTAVWIDKANKVVKAYIDGAWTAVS